eukprot:scaffold58365_cov19-Cyclotella_meneghiniana.AAC.1
MDDDMSVAVSLIRHSVHGIDRQSVHRHTPLPIGSTKHRTDAMHYGYYYYCSSMMHPGWTSTSNSIDKLSTSRRLIPWNVERRGAVPIE